MRIQVGKFIITAIREQTIEGLEDLIKEAKPETLAAIDWLAPNYMTEDFKLKGWIQSFLITGGEKTILVDTCVGNDKERPHDAAWHQQQGKFLDALRATGVTENDVDIVLCTHMHVDHVGWNTCLRGGEWVATFPKARYLFEREEFAHWQALAGTVEAEAPSDESRRDAALRRFRETQRLTFADSIGPIVRAGLAESVERDHRVCPGIELISTPGHTPGHVSVRVHDDGREAIISGDCVHHPCQIAHPSWRTLVDADHEQAARTRKRLFDDLARRNGLLIGSHFADPCAGKVSVRGAGFYFDGADIAKASG